MILSNASPTMIGSLVIILVGLIVIYDVLHLTRNKKTVPKLGYLPKGGFAWSSTVKEEFFRNGPNILTLICMAILPWLLASASNTPFWILAVFDILLMLLILTMLLPKRYAITKTSIFADGQRLEWKKIKKIDSDIYINRRIVLLREGWWIFAPLPLGGSMKELLVAKELIFNAQNDNWLSENNFEEE
ncbi:MAG: hypothetical protein CMB56_006820 [Methanobacteriota archaeon]|nr:MAG: hypothetical protein CMB56_006820 [Euryarchaeota archaeon]|tara:strand:+ start:6715 stop:7278 length:564 start_codon:yes stop_codon:yes gene_type:complete